MFLKRSLFLLIVTLWAAEPFLAVPPARPSSKSPSLCTMDETCPMPCCQKKHALQVRPGAGGKIPCFYSSGCHSDKTTAHFFPTSPAKHFAQTPPRLYAADGEKAGSTVPLPAALFESEVPSPPPELEKLS